jgi:hypothetical protein
LARVGIFYGGEEAGRQRGLRRRKRWSCGVDFAGVEQDDDDEVLLAGMLVAARGCTALSDAILIPAVAWVLEGAPNTVDIAGARRRAEGSRARASRFRQIVAGARRRAEGSRARAHHASGKSPVGLVWRPCFEPTTQVRPVYPCMMLPFVKSRRISRGQPRPLAWP